MTNCAHCASPLDPGGNCPACLLQLGLRQVPPQSGHAASPTAMPAAADLSPHFPQLEMIRNIGRGGMGAIYLARQSSLGRYVALKLLTAEVSTDAAFVERFEREARALAMLSHPHIVTVFDFGRTVEGLAYLIMEYVEGANLRQAMEARRMTPAEAVTLMVTISSAIEYAHAKGVVHRDLKPENILLGEDGTVKVADFGIAKIVNDPINRLTLTATRQVLGSPHYLAPEQIEAPEQVDHRVDLFALGVIFYELLTGQLPLGLFEPPSSVFADVNPRLDAIVLKLLHRKPDQRYQSVSHLLNDLRCLSSSEQMVLGVSPANNSRPASVPFTAETHGGLAEAQGIIQVTNTGILVEYIVTDAIFGSIKSDLKRVEINRDSLMKVYLSPGVFSSKLCIVTHTMTAISQLPGSDSGQVKLKVKNRDIDLAQQVVDSLGFTDQSNSGVLRHAVAGAYSPTHALLVMLCGILNGGFLAVVLVAILKMQLLTHPEMAVITISVFYGLLIFAQMAGSFVHLVSGLQAPWRVALLVSILPISPVFLISLPIAAWWWYRIENKSKKTTSNFAPTGKPGWTATTLVYLRENRTARILSALNIVGISLIAVGLAVYLSGWYPSVTRFRVVPSEPDATSNVNPDFIRSLISDRLVGIPGTSVVVAGESRRVEVRGWSRFLPLIQQRLEVPQAPSLVLIPGSPPIDSIMTSVQQDQDSAPDTAYRVLDIAAGLDVPNSKILGSGRKISSSADELVLDNHLVKAISMQSSDTEKGSQTMRCLWSARGRDEFHRFVSSSIEDNPSNAKWHLGLVVSGVIQAVAPLDESSNLHLDFSLSKEWILSAEALMAAVRGPDLNMEVEALQ